MFTSHILTLLINGILLSYDLYSLSIQYCFYSGSERMNAGQNPNHLTCLHKLLEISQAISVYIQCI